ncbi:MAG TPA: hypothetical protein VFY64_10115 [Nitrososphaeraceae archaeon]|nr:hypothetical protein [Nitrososphaeraceae archaeon]
MPDSTKFQRKKRWNSSYHGHPPPIVPLATSLNNGPNIAPLSLLAMRLAFCQY